MKWTDEAEKAIASVPFFVRKRVRRRIEEEAARSGSLEVRLIHVQRCRERFLNRMEDEVQGYQVETCFGNGGCPNRAVIEDHFPEAIEQILRQRDLKSFLKERVKGPLKLHHELRVSISDCPNACSRPQIADLGLIGACRPEISEEACIACGACVEACREEAIALPGNSTVSLNYKRCLSCGQCPKVCPTRTLQEGAKGYRIQVGGKLGRHPRLAQELPGIHGREEALAIIERCLDFYGIHCRKGERFGEILERTGMETLKKFILDSGQGISGIPALYSP
jgi:anaerobic sulfite reductase subunit C